MNLFVKDITDGMTLADLKNLMGEDCSDNCIGISIKVPIDHIFDTKDGKLKKQIIVWDGDIMRVLGPNYLACVRKVR